MKKNKKNNDMEYVKVPLNENIIKSFKLELDSALLIKDKNDLNQQIMEDKIEQEIAKKSANEALKEMEETLKNKEKDGRKLTEPEIQELKITIKAQEKFIKLDIPMRNARIELRKFIQERNKIDSPEMQISKLKKAIRTKYSEHYVPKANNKKDYLG